MKRRDFIKQGLGWVAATAAPSFLQADVIPDDGITRLPIDEVGFDASTFLANDPQTIIVFLSGGMSDVVGNTRHIKQIMDEDLSQVPYEAGAYEKDSAAKSTSTSNDFWREAGGEFLERMLADGEVNIFRTCYQTDRIQAHGINQTRYMHGNDKGYDSGIVTTLLHVLNRFDAVSASAKLTNVAIDGGNIRLLHDFAMPQPLPGFLRPVSFNRNFDNPYNYDIDDLGEVDLGDYSANRIFNGANFDSRLNALMQRHNHYDALSDVFNKRKEISDFIEETKNMPLPVEYPDTVDGRRFETAMRILTNNPDTKLVTISGGHSGWDDHSDAIKNHEPRAYELFEAIDAAMRHAKMVGNDRINIVLFGDFGRNISINSTAGWDHGNNQVVYWFGGRKFLNHLGIVGETELHVWMKKGRLYSRPTNTSYQFKPYSIAATVYAMFGIKNPEVLTGGSPVIGEGLATPFLV